MELLDHHIQHELKKTNNLTTDYEEVTQIQCNKRLCIKFYKNGNWKSKRIIQEKVGILEYKNCVESQYICNFVLITHP